MNDVKPKDFAALVEAEWAEVKKDKIDLPQEEIQRIRQYFAPPSFAALPASSDALDQQRGRDASFDAWVRRNTFAHRQPGYTIVNISLKPIGKPPGDITADQLDVVADLATRYSFDEARATHEQNLCLPHVKIDDLYAVWQSLATVGLAEANIGLVTDIIACPGLDYCALANTRSIPIAERISERFANTALAEDIGELKIKISGCINACGHHHVGHIGILGVDKKGEEFYQILLGGSGAEDASLGAITGRALSADETVDAIERLIHYYKEYRTDGERFLETYRRLGANPFKEVIYDDASA